MSTVTFGWIACLKCDNELLPAGEAAVSNDNQRIDARLYCPTCGQETRLEARLTPAAWSGTPRTTDHQAARERSGITATY